LLANLEIGAPSRRVGEEVALPGEWELGMSEAGKIGKRKSGKEEWQGRVARKSGKEEWVLG
jgi:hypothetical protein